MEGLSVSSTSMYSGLKGHWRRTKGYERLNGSKNMAAYKSRRFWKINLKPKMKLKLKLKLKRFSPKKVLMNMRDAYVNMMMKVASSWCLSSGIGGLDNGFGMRQLKEYDQKVLVEFYKSMIVARGQLVPRHGAGVGVGVGDAKFDTQIVCQR
ncbi:putative kinesin-4-like [Capsicum annuum]|uniref:uncharacterized protein LOC107855084 n=1 Tax=Capsicum annuum TaxID=4072 RepID=UPI0007BEF14A|nr:uncharacterized protein LOC107855084 [Capsicum annuum]KAF3622137.1 putative kinesin-4-like [Capsicum annuum]